MRDGFIDSIIPYLRGEIKGKVFFVQMKEKDKALGEFWKTGSGDFSPAVKKIRQIAKKVLHFAKRYDIIHLLPQFGALAQLGAHNTGSVGVRGSNPLCSTKKALAEASAFFNKICLWRVKYGFAM